MLHLELLLYYKVNPVIPGQTGLVPAIVPVLQVFQINSHRNGALVAVVGEAHVAFDVSITVTKAPFVSEVVLNDELFVRHYVRLPAIDTMVSTTIECGCIKCY
jgi:hypothetical protein